MDKYQVQWRYRSSLAGPWGKGDEIELEADTADAVNRDSPGVLVHWPENDRMVKGPAKARKEEGKKSGKEKAPRCPYCKEEFAGNEERDAHTAVCDQRPDNHGPITGDDFKATKGG
jgi:hypothetical protein